MDTGPSPITPLEQEARDPFAHLDGAMLPPKVASVGPREELSAGHLLRDRGGVGGRHDDVVRARHDQRGAVPERSKPLGRVEAHHRRELSAQTLCVAPLLHKGGVELREQPLARRPLERARREHRAQERVGRRRLAVREAGARLEERGRRGVRLLAAVHGAAEDEAADASRRRDGHLLSDHASHRDAEDRRAIHSRAVHHRERVPGEHRYAVRAGRRGRAADATVVKGDDVAPRRPREPARQHRPLGNPACEPWDEQQRQGSRLRVLGCDALPGERRTR
mmetsp:Transcript_19161/g.56247  ORF Transcript_19161/g.56247 Transcript_19161/m.56247 type:complete len:279 (-) Transcript_19161:57-893(-)